MSAVFGAGRRRAEDGSGQAGAEPGQIAQPGAYLTDGVSLYRVVGPVTSVVDQQVELEDCYRLEVVRVPLSELRERQLRVVKPAPLEG